MLKKLSLVTVVLLMLSFVVVNNFRELVIEKLGQYTLNYPEKVYVATDKPYYTLGEDIWLSAYLVNGASHKPSKISNVIYVELINPEDSIVGKRQLLIEDVSAAGDFKLKKNWKPGKYHIRAYSNYMRNQDQDYFFQAELPVWDVSTQDNINTNTVFQLDSVANSQLTPAKKPEIGFYPEGGYLITNIASKIAIKVKDAAYANQQLKGNIVDQNGNIIMPFQTYKFGLGVVKFTPEPNTSYHAILTTTHGKELKYNLPKALPEGYTLEISNIGKQIRVTLNSNTALGLKNTFLVAHQRGNLIYEKLQNEDLNSYDIKLDTKFLRNGITNFTLFNSSGKPVCERLVYVDNPNNNVNVNIALDNPTPTTDTDLNLELDLTDNAGTPLYGNLTVGITDIDVVTHDTKNETIKTYLLLNSDLKGTIEDPGYFFQKENDFRRRFLLDLLMLTHGWSRFTWQNILYENTYKNNTFEAEKGIYISGRTTALNGARQQISAPTRLTILGNKLYQENKTSNSKGFFRYGPYIFKDTLNVLLEARKNSFSKKDEGIKTNRDVAITLDNLLGESPEIDTKNNINTVKTIITDTSRVVNYLRKAKKSYAFNKAFLESQIQLEEVIINAEKQTQEEERNRELDKKTLYSTPNQRLDLSSREEDRLDNILDLINQIPSVQANQQRISIRNQGPPTLLLDGFNVEFDDIALLTGEDVEFIDVLIGPQASLFSNSNNGIIAIYSREVNISSNSNVKQKPGITDFTASGFYSAREFYTEDDLDINAFTAAPSALKSTLHWAPKIVLNASNSGKATTRFKTSDVESNYAIKIEGITTEGIPFFHLSTLEVK